MMHPVLAELQHWDREEYAAGYRARFSDLPNYETAHHCWRCGWENADTEALESARLKQALAEGREDHFQDTWGNLFDSGEEARANGVPFDEERTEPWKEGWIAVDISLGVLAERERGMKKGTQRAMHCRCGNPRILAVGLCPTCYTLKRQDEEYFGGLREAVLKRDGHRCRVCGKPGGQKRSLAVHHRVVGKSELELMITLCLAHHAMVTRTMALLEDWPELLRMLWREQHPEAHEQTALDFRVLRAPAEQAELL